MNANTEHGVVNERVRANLVERVLSARAQLAKAESAYKAAVVAAADGGVSKARISELTRLAPNTVRAWIKESRDSPSHPPRVA